MTDASEREPDGAMSLRDCRALVYPGAGAVARFGGSVVVTLQDDPDNESLAREIIEIVEAESDGAVTAPGRRIARRLAGLLGAADVDRAVSFGVVAQADPGVVVFVAGNVDVELSGPDCDQRFTGRDVASWVDRLVPWTIATNVTLIAGGPSSVGPDPRSDLRVGVVSGRGISLAPRFRSPDLESDPTLISVPSRGPRSANALEDLPDVPPPPEAAAMPEEGFIVMPLDDITPREPLPLAVADPVSDATAADLVEGIVCSRGHFNDPSALYCALCGISMVHQTHNLVEGLRPALGFLVLDNGATFVLDSNYVIGREPETDPAVEEQLARALPVTDPERSVSRVHARISLDGWRVQVGDASSANGTYVADPGEDAWTRLEPEELRTIRPGTRILVGRRPLVFESRQRG